MDAPSVRRVSLRGASAKEDSRAVFLEKIAGERAFRQAARRMAAAALTIQRIWRGRKAASVARNEVQLSWDEQLESFQSIPDAETFASDIVRPFLFFMRELSYRRPVFCAKDLQRVSNCFRMLLQTLNYSDNRNFCTRASGTKEQKADWTYQVHRLFAICSAVLTAKCNSDKIPSSLLATVMRLMVTLTDSKTLGCQEEEALRLLQWLADGNGGFYYAAHAFLLEAYSSRQLNSGTDNFIVIASVITIALRPLHAASAAQERRYAQDLEESKGRAAVQICRYILTVPCLIDDLPAGLLPAFQHPSVLVPCLHACKGASQTSFGGCDLPMQAWTLANVVTIVSSASGMKDLLFDDFFEAACSLLQNILPWVESVREKKKLMEEMDDDSSTAESLPPGDAWEAIIRLLKPLYDQHQVAQLLEKAKLTASAVPKLAKLYTYLLTVLSALNSQGGALPVLNVLAFTKQLLPQLWDWVRSCLKIEVVSASKTRTVKKESLAESQQSSKWNSSFLKKMKSATTELESGSEEGDEATGAAWHVNQLKAGPGAIPEEGVAVLTLFCTVYAHLLLVLDDDEFYSRQVPFTLEEQRTVCAVLNTMVYHGFFQSSNHQFSALMDASCRCLRALYERDSRRRFCPAELWLAPGVEMRPAIAAAARAHEVASVTKPGEQSQAPAMGSVLTIIPHVLPFKERVQIFREFVKSDKALRKMGGEVTGPGPGSIEISVRRDRVVEDAVQQLAGLGSRLKSCINVSFVNEYGLAEAGLDYGGLFKEFMTDLAKAAFDPGYGLFLQTATEEGFLFPHPAASSLAQGLQTMEFLGCIVGKALYEGILLEHSFSPVFISKFLGRYCPIDDLSSLDIELHRNLMYLKNYEGDVTDLALDFTVTEEIFGKRKVIELISGGAKVPVSDANKLQYVHAMADYKLNRQVRPVINAFIRGLTNLIAPSWLGLFNAKEFNQLLSGEEHDFNVDDLKENTRYTGGYTKSSRTIKLFWEVLEGFDAKERCAVLKFVTSCSRAPLLGFKHLQPPFTIHKVTCDTPMWSFFAGQDVDRLPSASTCYNILKLPTYRRAGTLREKLQYATRSNSGFELS